MPHPKVIFQKKRVLKTVIFSTSLLLIIDYHLEWRIGTAFVRDIPELSIVSICMYNGEINEYKWFCYFKITSTVCAIVQFDGKLYHQNLNF